MELYVFIAISFFGLPIVAGSECCDGYYDTLGSWHDPQWCDEYCCGSSALTLRCCDSELLRANSWDRSDFCVLWWKNHVWAPILTAVVCLGILISCCVCCYKCCCASKTNTVIVQNPGMGAGPMISTTMVSNQTSINAGYDQPRHY
ncbi:hypothetical protein ACF0H5_011003 [Mactra antiquata]